MRWYDRLRTEREIAFVRRRGRRVSLDTLTAYGQPLDGRARSRFGATVSKAVGGAVLRNLVRRRIRGALDACAPPAHPLRVMFVAREAAAVAPYQRIASDVRLALERLEAP